MTALPDPGTPFGAQVRARLDSEMIIWFATVGADGTPQPNPVWFLWQDGALLVFNRPNAKRLSHIEQRPQVSLHFNSDKGGGSVVVFTGMAKRIENHPKPQEVPEYVAKYGEAMKRIAGDVTSFGEAYPIAVRIEVERVRGF
ncbi:TIGR03667 family PPOX class F420-dependent oxidoreductase [Amycolatopsis pithecellobii]|uniref:TIGR03667 family PPOX class F420-dependent oxidoreductase n=1 Tax=Amycolatopsis pithecellobii TaxID=664692 RepID=A0A6N7Z6K6_9PSEU|nr:TIGR03667 family PPOX class F420-dependent oxidoreductase [Amycolatopsis pithecellobii]MTD58173.1 TIGR03667 family PPOX class F420-dependent oxidoreductase [Amycolatopsis pithecellobii]